MAIVPISNVPEINPTDATAFACEIVSAALSPAWWLSIVRPLFTTVDVPNPANMIETRVVG